MANDELLKRLGAQSRLVRDLRAEMAGLAGDEGLGQIEVSQLRPLEPLADDLLRRMEEQAEVCKVIAAHARGVRRAYERALNSESAITVLLDEAVNDIGSVQDHVALAIGQDEAGRFAEMEVLRLLQEGNLIGFGTS